jgi:hypothetical protein
MNKLFPSLALPLLLGGVAHAEPAKLDRAAVLQATRVKPAPKVTSFKGLKAGTLADEPAIRMLSQLHASFEPKLAQRLGLASRADVQNTEVGAAIPILQVQLNSLRSYDGSKPAAELLLATPLVVRLVKLRGQVKSSLLLAQANNAWRTVQIGDETRAVAIAAVTGTLVAHHGVTEADLALVRVPALGLDFLSYRSEGVVHLAPMFDRPELSLQAGSPLTLEQALANLAIAARQVAVTRSRG